MFNKRKLAVLLLFSIILMSSISLISAADSNSTDVQAADSDEIELELNDSNQDVLSNGNSFSDLNDLIESSTSSEISLDHNYAYNEYGDENSLIVEKDNIVIDGKGHTITGSTKSSKPAYGFNVTAKNVVIKNIHFVDMGSSYKNRNGGAILSSLNKNLTVINCTFKNCFGEGGGAISSASTIENCSFDYCYASMGGAVDASGIIRNSNFTHCNAADGGAVSQSTSVNCNFIDNYGGQGGAGRSSSFINCTFKGNSASYGGAVYQYFSSDVIINCTFIGNDASTGGALYSPFSSYYVINSTFENNTASSYAVSQRAHLVLCSFKNNTANNGLPYESSAIGKPTLYSTASSYYVTCPNQVEIPINYAFKWGTGANDYFTYQGKVYLFNGINTTLELCERNSYNVIDKYSVLSGSSFIADLDKGTYTLRARSASGDSSITYYIYVYGEKTSIAAENYTEMYVGEDKCLVVNLTGHENNPLVGFNVSLKENGNVLGNLVTNSTGQVSFSIKDLPLGLHNLYLEFLEDARHEASSLSVSVLVKKFDVMLEAENVTAYSNEDISLLVNLTDMENNPMEGYVLYLKENDSILANMTTNSLGQVRFSLNDLSAGSHNLYVEFLEDENYSYTRLPVSAVIKRFSTAIKADNVDAFISDDLSLIVNLTDDENNPMMGYVIYLKENGNVLDNLTTNSSGQVSFSLSDMSAGSHNLYVEFLGDRIYEGSVSPVAVAIDKFYSSIEAGNVSAFTYDDINLIATLTDGSNAPMQGYVVYLKENGNVLYNRTTDEFGKATFLLNDLSEGTHSLYVEFMETRFYRGSAIPVTAEIKKMGTILKADNITAYAVEDINLLVNLTDENNNLMKGYKICLKENGNVLYNLTTDELGQVRFSLNDLYAGRHLLHVELLESKLYGGSVLPVSVVINRFSTSIQVKTLVAFTIDDKKLNACLFDDDHNLIPGCTLYLKENGNVLDNLTTDEFGNVSFSLNNLSAGNHNLYVEFSGNRIYNDTLEPVSVYIIKAATRIEADNVVAFPDEGKVIVRLIDQKDNLLNDSQVYITLAYLKDKLLTPIGNGEYEYDIIGLASGNFTARITFNEDDIYFGTFADINVEIKHRLDSNIYADNLTVYYKEYGTLIAYLKDSNGDPIGNEEVKLTVNGKYDLLLTGSDGRVDFDLARFNLPSGSYDAVLSFGFTNRYTASCTHVNITVDRLPTVIIAPDVNCTYGDNTNLVATLKDKNGNPLQRQAVTAKINSRTIEQGTDENGHARWVINLFPGIHTVEISFMGTNGYDSSSCTVHIFVNETDETPEGHYSGNHSGETQNNGSGQNQSSQTPANSSSSQSGQSQNTAQTTQTTSSGDGVYVVVTLKDDSGNLLINTDVIIDIDGQAKSYKTNAKGQVKIPSESLVPKTYKAKVIVLDANKQKASSFNINLVVKKAKPKIIAKNKKFKAKKKVKKYAVYLKVGKKPVKNVRVTIKIKGKTYKAKTNYKGKAIFKLKKLTKKGTYRAVIKFNGNKWYSKVTKKVKIKVR